MTDLINSQEIEYSRKLVLEAMASLDTKTIVSGLLTIVFCDKDWQWVQELCIDYSKSSNENIWGIALLCFGHLARIHRILDVEIVNPILQNGLKDQSSFVRGHAESALGDIDHFIPKENKI